jgi:hypothetical protein
MHTSTFRWEASPLRETRESATSLTRSVPSHENRGRGLRRVMGVFALALAMGGSGLLLKERATTEAVLDWATFGNGRAVRAWASDLRAVVRGTPAN